MAPNSRPGSSSRSSPPSGRARAPGWVWPPWRHRHPRERRHPRRHRAGPWHHLPDPLPGAPSTPAGRGTSRPGAARRERERSCWSRMRPASWRSPRGAPRPSYTWTPRPGLNMPWRPHQTSASTCWSPTPSCPDVTGPHAPLILREPRLMSSTCPATPSGISAKCGGAGPASSRSPSPARPHQQGKCHLVSPQRLATTPADRARSRLVPRPPIPPSVGALSHFSTRKNTVASLDPPPGQPCPCSIIIRSSIP